MYEHQQQLSTMVLSAYAMGRQERLIMMLNQQDPALMNRIMMYYDYFNLKQPPFKITPDTSLFFPGGDRGAILDALIYAILSGEGIVK